MTGRIYNHQYDELGLPRRYTFTAEWRIYTGIKRRCYNKKQINYERYGARGIVMCDRWRDSFAAFYHDVGPRPSPTHSLDRIDNTGNYEPGNVRWATSFEQTRNSRRNKMLTFQGETMCITDWTKKLGFPPMVVQKRLRRGWTVERALTEPLHGNQSRRSKSATC